LTVIFEQGVVVIERANRVVIGDEQAIESVKLPRGVVRLITPVEGEVTLPLQQYPWPEEKQTNPVSENGKSPTEWQQFLAEYDRSVPRPVTFAWEFSTSEDFSPRFDLEIAKDAHFNEKVLAVHGLAEMHADVYNLSIGTPYYWKIVARAIQDNSEMGRVLAESGVGHFSTNPTPPRWICVPGVTNVRDIGGWPLPDGRRVRQGMIYRGSEMNSHCAISPEGHTVMVDDLGILTDLDLRGMGEERKPVLDIKKVEYINIPVLAYDSIASPEYTGRYRAVFNLLATRSMYPIFMHCWGGADRTGTVAFLILALLGVSNDDLSTEYELTSLSVWGERRRNLDAFQVLLQTLELFAAKGSSIQTQVERYMKVIGVTGEEVERIKEILTE
jgi:protein tyrosine/serine phosphatase